MGAAELAPSLDTISLVFSACASVFEPFELEWNPKKKLANPIMDTSRPIPSPKNKCLVLEDGLDGMGAPF